MAEAFNLILDFIRIDLLIGFGWYTLFFFIVKLFSCKKQVFIEFDKIACKTVVFLGIFYGLFWLFASVIAYLYLLDVQEKTEYIQRLRGPYSFGLWLQPIFWVGLTQLLRMDLFRRYLLLRLMISALFLVSFERFVIMFTAFHRDYLPSSWTMYTSGFGIAWYEFPLSILIKTSEFVIIAIIYNYIQKSLPNFKKTKFN
ncbi:MAG: hypothetical protein QM710_08365 [Flavobacterium sp.]